LTWLKFLLCNFFLNTVDCCDVFPLSFSILFLYFSKLYLSIFFLILSWLRIWFCNFFLWNIVDCYSVSPHGFFPSKIIFILFYFLILNWLKITVTICEESTITIFENYCPLLQCFFPYGFFYNFFQIILFNFIFLILSCLWITITNHYK